MALMTLLGSHFYSSGLPTCRILTCLRKYLSPDNRKGRKIMCQGYFSLQQEQFGVYSHHAYCKKHHSEKGRKLYPVGGSVLFQTAAWNRFEQNNGHVDEQRFYKDLNTFTSSEQVLKFVSTLETLSDTMAAAALCRVSEVEQEEGGQNIPRTVLENEIFRALCFQFEYESTNLSDTGLVTTLQALTGLHVDPQSNLLVSLVTECQNRLQQGHMTIHNLCILGKCMIKLQNPNCAILKEIILQLQGKKLQECAPEEIVAVYTLLQAAVGEVVQHQDFLDQLNNLSISLVYKFSPKITSQILNALVALNQTRAFPLVIKLCIHSIRFVSHFTSEELGKVLEGFMHFGYTDKFFMQALEQHVSTCCLTMHPESVSKVMQYCSKKMILSKPIFDAVAESFIYQAEIFSPVQVSQLIVPFGKLNYLPPNASLFFRKLEDTIRTRFKYFPPHDLLNLLHSCTLIGCHPVNYVAKLFSPYFLQKLQDWELDLGRSSQAQLTQLYLTVVLECPFYKGPKLLPQYQVKSFLIPPYLLETPMDLQLYRTVSAGLIDILKAKIYFASRVSTPCCYTVDTEIKLDEEGFVLPFTSDEDVFKRLALCIDDRKRFCLNSHNLLGKEAIKQRHLQLLGYEVIQIPYHEVEILQSRCELVKYLKKKLFPHSFLFR
ncbi:FAST kinase domain-containing protein 3, mitochondrial [Vombatus ursinus]|uniref:FAST kinase domains 3 n=1 Tax=Vombatus ursinus TaxID=29139 RepID=A0A4X2LV39_VOMUR|nr:FAST kinase domain-containing protein 3, mitochondrial [Vombatus ursinus]XP_027724725.1 FAST kinase domain-containing protein 3, mitochondrial [Vombatus ursinus]XP_027724726.1 FAST kinase domain-containing protein 3, mitochondrial [Vombatus ursinus]XP_027724727.1 FAST kinase domain-containing protein 3, mitochondrial [Vombatus ursinus]